MESKKLFLNTEPLRLFFIASIPGAIGMLASALYQLIDGIFVGQILGATAFASLNLAMPFVIINFSLADLIGVGSSVPISISLGKGENKKADNIFTCAFIMIILAGILIGSILYFAAPFLISLMGAEGAFALFALKYLRVYALLSPVTTMIFAMDNYLRICGKIRGSMLLNIFMSVISCILEFVFLYVLKMDITGAALATCSGMFICIVIALIPFLKGNMTLHFCRPHFSISIITQIISCGSPNFLNNIAGRLTSIMLNIILVRFGGETAVSVYGILMYVEGFIQPLLYGMCDSLQPAIGYNWGAGRFTRVRAIGKCCFTASIIVSLVSAVVIYVFPEPVTLLFMDSPSAYAMAMSITALKIFALTYVTRWFSFAVQSFMLAIGKAFQASAISLSTALIFPLILIVLLWDMELTGIWLNFPLTSLLAGILALFIILKAKKELFQHDSD